MKRACIVHDAINLGLLPIIAAMTVAGLTGHMDPALTTYAFMAYIVADFVWVCLQPDAVPSLPSVILLHHAVTFVLLCAPLRHPHLHWYTCVDGLVELNTFFLIARRQWRTQRKLFSWLYWGSFFPLRMLLYPAMVPVFLHEMRAVEAASWWETLLCVGSQVFLCGFNVVLLALSVMNWRKRQAAAASTAEGKEGAKASAGVGPASGAGAPSNAGKLAAALAGKGSTTSGGAGLKQRRGGVEAAAASGAGHAHGEQLLAAKHPAAGADNTAALALKARAV